MSSTLSPLSSLYVLQTREGHVLTICLIQIQLMEDGQNMENGVPALQPVVKELRLAPELAPNLLQLTVEQNVKERRTKTNLVTQEYPAQAMDKSDLASSIDLFFFFFSRTREEFEVCMIFHLR